MHWASTLISETGQVALDLVWFPTIIWSIAAALACWGLRAVPDSKPIYHYNLRVAMLGSLPAGIIAVGVLALVSHVTSSVSASEPASNAVFAVQNPLPVVVANGNPAPAVNWGDPYLWIGLITILLIAVGLGKLIQMGWNYYTIRSFDRMLDTELPRHCSQNLQHTKVIYTERAEVPFTFGWRRPVIVIPSALKSRPDQRRMAIRHELMHIKRGDFLVNSLINALRAVFWFHPLVQVLSGEVDEYRELSCDAEVLEDQTISRKAYAQLLLDLAPKKETYPRQIVSMSVNESTLQKRIKTMKNVSHHHRPSRKSMAMSLVVFLSVAGIMACSDLQNTGITNNDVQQVQTTLQDTPADSRPLFVLQEDKNLDGTPENKEIFQPGTVPTFDPKHIKSLGKLSGDEAIQKYGQRGANGVVVITLYDKQVALSDTSSAFAPSTNTTSSSPRIPHRKNILSPLTKCLNSKKECGQYNNVSPIPMRLVLLAFKAK